MTNWASAQECVRCKFSFAELPPAIAEMLAFAPSQPHFSMVPYVSGFLIGLVLIGSAIFFYSETAGFDKENKTTLLSRLYWNKPPPSGKFLKLAVEERLKCKLEYRRIDAVIKPARSTQENPCLNGSIPRGFQLRPEFRNIKRCSELPEPKAIETGEEATVELAKAEIVYGKFERLPALDPDGAKNGEPEKSATLFFRAAANVDYFITMRGFGMHSEMQERRSDNGTVELLLYWNEQTSSWEPFEDCDAEEEADTEDSAE